MSRVSTPTEAPIAPLHFVKVEGAGNDYVLVDVFDQRVDHPAEFARRVSHRHRSIGADGVLLVGPAPSGSRASASMAIHNADGSVGMMCGNGLRCVVRYLSEVRGMAATEAQPLTVHTASGELRGHQRPDGRVTIEMGEPRFDAAVDTGWDLADPPRAYFVSTGNDHLIVRVADPGAVDIVAWGRALGEPRDGMSVGANVHAVAVHSDRIVVRPWELGSGPTQACGTGAVASVAVARAQGWLADMPGDDDIVVEMPGGELAVRWPGSGTAWLTGPAELVYRGELPSC